MAPTQAELDAVTNAAVERIDALVAENKCLLARHAQTVEALKEARDVFVRIQAEPLDTPRYWLIKTARRAWGRIEAALEGHTLTIEWVGVGETEIPGWFVCDAKGPIEGSYAERHEAEAARAALAADTDSPEESP